MAKKLHELTEGYLKSCPYIEIQDVLDKLNNVSINQGDLVIATETFDTYLEFLQIIKKRILNDPSLDIPKHKINGTIRFVDNIIGKLRHYADLISFIRSNQEKIHSYASDMKDETAKSLEQTNERIMHNMNELANDVSSNIKEAKDKFDESEHNILTHVLTLLGVFSAIIITIMSVVITSSSWLNSADGNRALIAFIVPTLVTILAVIALVSLVYGLYGNDNSKEFFKKYILYVVIILCVLIICFVNIQSKSGDVRHTCYIIQETEYDITNNGNSICYVFTIDGKQYHVPYDKTFLHNNNELHFCIQHNAIE